MTIQEWGAIGEVVGGVAVVLSLLYLAYQISQSTKTAKAASRQSILDTFNDAAWEVGKHPHLQRVTVLGMNSFDALSEDDKTTFGLVMSKFGGNVYNALLLRRAGLLDEETLEFIGGRFVSSVAAPGGLQWWQTERTGFFPHLLIHAQVMSYLRRKESGLCLRKDRRRSGLRWSDRVSLRAVVVSSSRSKKARFASGFSFR
jgi:hypothetical protein